ncbi:MAG: alkaline phosphatase D family protein [Gammaproteobacteria bacterium]|nr:alkaline phosphatase D family protein [Gammaproteobacteria bacterium]
MTRISRRDFTRMAIGAAAMALPVGRLAAQVRFGSYVFQLGVASGDPTPDGFVIWTRLAPEPMDTSRLGNLIYEVQWEVAEDPGFARKVKEGVALARPHLAHAVHVEVEGLGPGREYFYRFRIGRDESPVGRAVTAPAVGAPVDRLRVAFSSCAHYEQGFFSAYRYMAEDKPDLMMALGDYIYEDAWGERRVRLFDKVEAVTLEDYRHRYTQYRADPDLQAAHAASPWLVTWDDHEVDNDYVSLRSEHEACGGDTVRKAFTARRAAAYQAWFEHMPVRPSRMRLDGDARIYGTTAWGDLARIYLLDTRQYRSPQACATPATLSRCDVVQGRKLLFGGAGGGEFIDPSAPDCRAQLQDPSRTVLGEVQERWLEGELAAGGARWNLLAQAVMFATIRQGGDGTPNIWSDAWAGYPVARDRLLAALASHKVANPVVLTGDIHSFWLNEVEYKGRTAAVELVTSSIATSNNERSSILPYNPQVKFHDGTHSGYVRCDLTRDKLRADFVGLDDMRDMRTGRKVLASFEVDAGSGRARRV